MNQFGRKAIWMLLALVAIVLYLAVTLDGSQTKQRDQTRSRAATLEALGVDSLAILSECNSTRKPSDGACACLSDIPGGYCYHTNCDLEGLPPILEDDIAELTVVSKESCSHDR